MRTAAALVAVSLLLAGCSGDPDTATEITTETEAREAHIVSGSVTVGTPTPATAPGFIEQPASSTFSISDVRIDNGTAVFSLAGDGVVNYVVRYVDEPALYGSNRQIDVPGRSILQLDLITDPTADTGPTYESTVSAPESDGVVFAHTVQASEGVFQAFLGTAGDRTAITVVPHQDTPTLTLSVSGAA